MIHFRFEMVFNFKEKHSFIFGGVAWIHWCSGFVLHLPGMRQLGSGESDMYYLESPESFYPNKKAISFIPTKKAMNINDKT